MPNVIGEFVGIIGADMKGFNTGIGVADGKMSQFAASFARHRKAIGIGMTAMGGAILGGFGMATKSAADFEAGMREANTMMGLGQEEFAAMSKDVLALAKNMGINAVDSTGALYQAISAGVPKENVLTFLEVASKAAIGGVTDTETAVDGLTTVINAFKIPMEDAQKVADVMFTTVKGGKTTFEELSSKLFNVAPIAAATGIAFEEVSAAIATMTKQGYPTAQATTAIRQAMVALQKPTVEMGDVLGELGYESGEAMVKELGFGGALEKLREATGGSNELLMRMFGSVEAGGAVLALTGQNAGTFTADLEAMKHATDGAGASQEAFNEVEEGAARQFEKAKERINAVVIEIGNNFLPKLTPLIEKVGEITGKVAAWMEANPKLTGTLINAAAVVGVLLAVLGPLVMMLPLLAAGFTILLGPVGIAIAAFVALTTAGIAIYQNWDLLRLWAYRIFLYEIPNIFKNLLQMVINIFTGIGNAMWEPIKNAIQWIIDYIEQLMATLQALWGMFARKTGGGEGGIVHAPGTVTTKTKGLYEPVYMQEGGVVPGLPGQAVPAILHGQERVVPAGKAAFEEIVIPITLELDGEKIAEVVMRRAGESYLRQSHMEG